MTKNTKKAEKFLNNFVVGIDKALDKAIEEEKQELEPKRKHKLPVILEPEEAQNLLRQPNKRYPTGLRNKAMMSLMLNCGLRVSEVINLRPGNINLTKGKLRVEAGKGNRDRDLAIPEEYLTDLLDSWRKKRPESSFFFSTLKGKKLSIRYLQQMVKRYAQKAGLNKRISPHTLRHTYATQYYKQTKDIETLRRILGHSDISTTTIYITLANIDVENGMKSFKGFL
jgi:integrase/recombinase XerD